MKQRQQLAVAPLATGATRGISLERNHVVQFYESDDFLCRSVVNFLGDAFKAGEPIVVIATEPHRQAVGRQLELLGFNVTSAAGSGQLEMIDAQEALAHFMVSSMPKWTLFRDWMGGIFEETLGRRSSHCRVYTEMVELLWCDGNHRAAIKLEQFWNNIRQTYPSSLMCGYTMGNFHKESDGESFLEICTAHTHVVPTERFFGDDPDASSRQVTALQQRARALETELEHRKHLEDALRNALEDRARLHQEAQLARQTAEEANKAKDEFLAMLGHELRNPLSPIVTALQLIKLKGDGTSSKENRIIERQVGHMVRLVDDLLDVSRITRGKMEIHKTPLELCGVIIRAVEMASPLLEQRQHRLSVEVPREGMRVEGDEVRLAQVFANLLTNAAKYTEPAGDITVTARRDGQRIIVSVKDNGHGISADLLPRVFDLFQQGRQSPARTEGGLGIGLALVRSIAAIHRGTVAAASEGLGKGSEFTVCLPALPEVRIALSGAHSNLNLSSLPQEQGRRILIVDDNTDAAELIAEMLNSFGHTVACAPDGPSALELVSSFRPNVALLDIGLPVMDGYELAQRLRERLNDSPPLLIAVTGYGQEKDLARSREAGFDHHLVKPVDAEKLTELISPQKTCRFEKAQSDVASPSA